jgi:hypothetical protein
MKLIAELVRRALQRGKTGPTSEMARRSDNQDRSSMSDFVRILQAHDRDRQGAN